MALVLVVLSTLVMGGRVMLSVIVRIVYSGYSVVTRISVGDVYVAGVDDVFTVCGVGGIVVDRDSDVVGVDGGVGAMCVVVVIVGIGGGCVGVVFDMVVVCYTVVVVGDIFVDGFVVGIIIVVVVVRISVFFVVTVFVIIVVIIVAVFCWCCVHRCYCCWCCLLCCLCCWC